MFVSPCAPPGIAFSTMFPPGHAVASWIGRLRGALILLVLLALGAEAAEPKRVLLIHSASRDVAPVDAVFAAFRAELARLFKQPVAFHEISLAARRAGSMDDGPFRDFLRNHYGAEKPDLVVTLALPALLFYLRDREGLFPEVPLLVTSIDERRLKGVKLKRSMATDLLPAVDALLAALGSAKGELP